MSLGSTRPASLAREALAVGDLARAAAILAASDPASDSPAARAEVLRLRAQLALFGVAGGHPAYPQLATEAAGLAEAAPAAAAATLANAAVMALYMNHGDDATELLQRAESIAGDDPVVRRTIDLTRVVAHGFGGRLEQAIELLDRLTLSLTDAGSIVESVNAVQATVVAAASGERYDLATEVAARAVASMRRVGATGMLPLTLCLLANSAYFVGDLDTVLVAAGEARDIAAHTDQPAMTVFAATCAALGHAVRGSADQLRAMVQLAQPLMESAGMAALSNTLVSAEALLALGAEDHAAAAVAYDRIDASLRASGRRTGVIQWRADRIEALHRAGRTGEAVEALDELASDIGDLPLAWSQTVLLRCRGLLAASGWEAMLQEALHRHPRWMSPFELGRTHLVAAERCGAAGRMGECREHAEAASAAFRGVDAAPWLARARRLCSAGEPVDLRAGAGPADSAAVAERVTVRALGPLTVARGAVEQVVGTDTAGRLLRFLIARGGQASVDEVTEVLWPDSAAQTGATRLRNVLSRARAQWGDVLVRKGDIVRLAPAVTVDAQEFEREAERAIADRNPDLARQALGRYRADLLPAARYDDWAVFPRERMRRALVRLLSFLADASLAGGDGAAAADYLQRVTEVDPHDESTYLRLAELLLESGRTGAARQVIDRAAQIDAEFGMAPSEALLRLQRRTRASG